MQYSKQEAEALIKARQTIQKVIDAAQTEDEAKEVFRREAGEVFAASTTLDNWLKWKGILLEIVHPNLSVEFRYGVFSEFSLSKQSRAPGNGHRKSEAPKRAARDKGAEKARSHSTEPVDLWGKFDPPALPSGLLPEAIEQFAREQGSLMGADAGGLAVAALAVCAAAIPDRIRLQVSDFLRHELELTGTHLGCEHGICGACTVLIDGRTARGCLMLAAQISGKSVDTIEGLSESGKLEELQAEFIARNAAQCGFCSSGMLLTGYELLSRRETLSRAEIREFISGNMCRCTGYHAIVDAVEAVMARRGSS